MVQLNVMPWYAKPSHLEKEDKKRKRYLTSTPNTLNLKKCEDVVMNLAEKN